MTSKHERYEPARREFLKLAGRTVVGGSAAAVTRGYAHHHPRPSPQSLQYLDQRMYFNNMELVGHVPGPGRGGGMQMMSAPGGQRLIFQGADVIDVTDPRNPKVINKGAAAGGQLAYNAQLRKWILIQSSAVPYFSIPSMPGGRFTDPRVNAEYKDWKGLRGIRMWDASDPGKLVKISEFSTGQTGSGSHGDSAFYDGGKYAYIDCAPDDTYTGILANLTPYSNCLMIVDVSDPSNVKEVSRWWVPGQRAGVAGEVQHLKKWKLLEGRGAEKIPDRPLSIDDATAVFQQLKFPALDRMPYTMSHLPLYVPRRIEDGGTLGFGTWSAFGFMTHDLSDIRNPRMIGRFDPTPKYGMDGIPFHSMYLGMLSRGIIVTNSESLNPDCNESWLPNWVLDVRDPRNPVPIAQLPRPKPPAEAPYNDFCFARARFSAHITPALNAPGRMSPTFMALSFFNAGIRCYDLSDPRAPKEVAYFVAPHGGTLSPECVTPLEPEGEMAKACDKESLAYNRPVDQIFIEWDRNLIYAATTTGLYVLSTPALGKPVLGAMPVTEWSLPHLNAGAPA
jgi:hypothetical protein